MDSAWVLTKVREFVPCTRHFTVCGSSEKLVAHVGTNSDSVHAMNIPGIRRSLQATGKWVARETARNKQPTAYDEEQAYTFGMLSCVYTQTSGCNIINQHIIFCDLHIPL